MINVDDIQKKLLDWLEYHPNNWFSVDMLYGQLSLYGKMLISEFLCYCVKPLIDNKKIKLANYIGLDEWSYEVCSDDYLNIENIKKIHIQIIDKAGADIKETLKETKTDGLKTTNEDIQLSEEQNKLFNIMETTLTNMYITGKAGTGKSELLKYHVRNTKKEVAVLAPTGVAALNVEGQTIHSFFGLSFGIQDLEQQNIVVSSKLNDMLNVLDTIIIDEISMVSPDIIEMINKKCQKARGNKSAFGGIQVICFGDLYQLPPVIKDKEIERYFNDTYGGIFFFNAPVFKNVGLFNDRLTIYELEHIFRQSDSNFKDILNQIRIGINSKEIIDTVNTRLTTTELEDRIITIATTNATVDKINKSKLDEINSKEHIFVADIEGDMKENSFPTDRELHLKVGAQIMMMANDIGKNKRWVNGTIGVISELTDNEIRVKINDVEYKVNKQTWESYRYDYNAYAKKLKKELVSSFTQFPIRLAWAITIHKSQGKTYDSVLIDLGFGAFDTGQVYVALSRCISLDRLYLKSKLKANDIKVNSEVVNFMKSAEIIKLNEEVIV